MDDLYNLNDCRIGCFVQVAWRHLRSEFSLRQHGTLRFVYRFARRGENDTRVILDNYIAHMLYDTSFGTLAPIARQPLPAERSGAGLLIQRGVFGRC
jgi:hypothetical protein